MTTRGADDDRAPLAASAATASWSSGVDVAGQGEGGDGAVHRPRIEAVETELGRHGARDGGFPGSGRPVDGDDQGPGCRRAGAGQAAEVVGEPGIAGLHRAEPGDEAALARGGGECGDGGRHGHAVVPLTVEARAAEVGAARCAGDAGDRQCVAVGVGAGPEGGDHVDHRLQPIHLLDPQLPHVVEDGRALARRPRPPPARGSRRERGSRPRPPSWPAAGGRRGPWPWPRCAAVPSGAVVTVIWAPMRWSTET